MGNWMLGFISVSLFSIIVYVYVYVYRVVSRVVFVLVFSETHYKIDAESI